MIEADPASEQPAIRPADAPTRTDTILWWVRAVLVLAQLAVLIVVLLAKKAHSLPETNLLIATTAFLASMMILLNILLQGVIYGRAGKFWRPVIVLVMSLAAGLILWGFWPTEHAVTVERLLRAMTPSLLSFLLICVPEPTGKVKPFHRPSLGASRLTTIGYWVVVVLSLTLFIAFLALATAGLFRLI